MSDRCPHNALPAEGVFNAPIGHCRCCGYYFPYISTGSYTANRQETVSQDTTLCQQCGGKPRRRIVEKGVVTLYEPGTEVPVAHHGQRGTG